MSAGHPVVLLPPAPAAGSDWSAVALALAGRRTVLTPDLTPRPGHAVVLEEPALTVLSAISGAGLDAAALCGLGYGAMVALMVASGFGERVPAMVLSTARTPESTAILSLHRGVRGLLPATVLQRLGGRTDQVVDALDQVRPIDYRGWASGIQTPTLVLVGQHDVANLGPSQALARTLPQASLRVVAGAGAGWQQKQPERFATLVAEFVDANPA
jgi:pimeloyl-ACP methyl ester carboxylesterase